MEKDFTKETPDSQEAPSEDENGPEEPNIFSSDDALILAVRIKSLAEKMEEEKVRLAVIQKRIEQFEAKFQLSTSAHLESPLESPTHEPQTLSNDACKNLSDSGISLASLHLSFHEALQSFRNTKEQYDDIMRFYDNVTGKIPIFDVVSSTNYDNSTEKTVDNENQSSDRTESDSPSDFETNEESVNIVKGKESSNPTFRYKKGSKTVTSSNSPEKSVDNEIQSSDRTESDSLFDFEIIESNKELVNIGKGKGKEASNPAFRYKKGSKTASSGSNSPRKVDNPIYSYEKESKARVSPSKPLAKVSPIKSSNEAFRSPVSKTRDPQSPKAGLNKISPAIKRKVSDSNENDSGKSCDGTSVTSESHGSSTNDGVNIAKRLKFEDDEKVSEQCPILDELLSLKTHKSMDITEFMDPSQTEQTSTDMEQSNLPSASGEESSLGSARKDDEKTSKPCPFLEKLLSKKTHESLDLEQFMDLPQTDRTFPDVEQFNLPSTSGLSNVVGSLSNTEESSLGSANDEIILSETEESPITTVSEDFSENSNT